MLARGIRSFDPAAHFTLLLQTWTQDQRRHMHVHALMACGVQGQILRELHNYGYGAQEDLVHLMLNVKGVMFRMQDRDEVVLVLRKDAQAQ